MIQSRLVSGIVVALVATLSWLAPAELHGEGSGGDAAEEAAELLAWYVPLYQAVDAASTRANWASVTDVSDRNTGQRVGAELVFTALVGHPVIIERVRSLLEHSEQLDDLTVRQLRRVLRIAAGSPGSYPELVSALIEVNAEQEARLDGFDFCLEREDGECTAPATANDIDRILRSSTDLDERLRAWEASKEVGPALRDGLIVQRQLRNEISAAMGYEDYMAMQASDYGMGREEMVRLMGKLVEQVRPLYEQLHCWAKHELAERYGQPAPRRIPAHWLPNRWAQWWPGMVSGAARDELFEDLTAPQIVEIAERFYTSMGFPSLPPGFHERSDLYPVPVGEERRKNSHASAWHLDWDQDVRSLMSVEANQYWFTTVHHELGHIYYYMAYSTEDVPLLLRRGANRGFHEAIGSQIGMVASQPAYLRQVGLMAGSGPGDEISGLLDEALSGYAVVFIPFAAGVMSHFENDLYGGGLSAAELNERWWRYAADFQGVEPPAPRPEGACDACTKTHIINDPAQYYDYALSSLILHQLHRHICREVLHKDVHACSYYGSREAGDFLRSVMAVGAKEDWQQVLERATGEELSAAAFLEYFEPVRKYLAAENEGRDCSFVD